MIAPGEACWADFAEAIFGASAALGGPSASVRHIGTADYPTPATRPPIHVSTAASSPASMVSRCRTGARRWAT